MLHLQDILGLYGFTQLESQGLINALDIVNCHIAQEDSASIEKELELLNETLQTCCLRPDGTERQQLEDKFSDEELRTQLLPLLSPFIKSIHTGDNIPTKLLLGASENVTRERFKALVDLEKKGYHTDTIYLLGGRRDLWIDYEPIATKLVIEQLVITNNFTEEEAKATVKKAIDEFFLDKNDINAKRTAIVKHFIAKGITWPTESIMLEKIAKDYSELTGTKFILVDTPMKLDDIGQLVRPDTLDTFKQLWQNHGEDISCAAQAQPNGKLSMAIVTTQPYAIYQYSQSISVFFDKPVNILVVADEFNNPRTMNIGAAFDSLARIIYAGKNVVTAKLAAITRNQEL